MNASQAVLLKTYPYLVQLSLLALAVNPELRLTDVGLVDGNNCTFLPVVAAPAQ